MVRASPNYKRKGLALSLDAVVFMLFVAIITAFAANYYSKLSEDSKYARARSEVASIAVAVNQYAYEMREPPASISALASTGTKDGITYGPWLQKNKPLDPWGAEYQISSVSEGGHVTGFIVYTLGKGSSGTAPTKDNFTGSNNNRIGVYVNGAVGFYGRYGTSF